jgi:hypothetical protein
MQALRILAGDELTNIERGSSNLSTVRCVAKAFGQTGAHVCLGS